MTELIDRSIECMTLLMTRMGHFNTWIPQMEVTVVAYSSEEAFQAFQTGYYAVNGEHFCYTITDWLELSEEAKAELVGKKVMLIKPRTELIGLSGALLFRCKRWFTQRGNEFVAMRDQEGLSGVPYIYSHSY